ncbi:MAG TPA: serine hydrolase [Aggregatilineales bacterium]|nr:serine hydrolase [Anaerolineales bacterium]HRE47853.1 serine hydrolase [Aggregatilineales bacterium]
MNGHALQLSARALRRAILILWIVLLSIVLATAARAQGVTAEAYGKANLRAGPAIEYPVVGEIAAGTAYPIIGRSARFPWYLLQLPDHQGWVFRDLVQVRGNIESVPYSDLIITPGANTGNTNPTATAFVLPSTLPPTLDLTNAATAPVVIVSATPDLNVPTLDPALLNAPTSTPTSTPTPSPSLPPSASAVYAEAIEIANIRFAPYLEAQRVGEIKKGEKYAVLRRHSQVPWLEIAYAGVASGRAWVNRDLVTVTGDLNNVPATSETNFGYPTLTATPNKVVAAISPWTGQPVGASPALNAMGNQVYDYLVAQGYLPNSPKQGSVFLLDLTSGEALSLNANVVYSGVSLMKIPVMVAFFRRFNIPDPQQAQLLPEMIACSENLSSNKVLAMIGSGDEYAGTQFVTQTMQGLGLKNTFLARSFLTNVRPVGATPTEQPFAPPPIPGDATQTDPDPSNQTTPEDMGWLLSAIYTCALTGDGPLRATYPDEIDQNDCRRMIRIMRSYKIGAMLEAGVPPSISVAHKVGWADEVHSDAGIFFTPGGDYIVAITLRNRKWLLYDESFPVFGEISRQVYNLYNPTQPSSVVNNRPIPDSCTIETVTAFDPTLVQEIQLPEAPPIK